jgi:hypothetical protein
MRLSIPSCSRSQPDALQIASVRCGLRWVDCVLAPRYGHAQSRVESNHDSSSSNNNKSSRFEASVGLCRNALGLVTKETVRVSERLS